MVAFQSQTIIHCFNSLCNNVLLFQTLIKGQSGCNAMNVNLAHGISEYKDINPDAAQIQHPAPTHQITHVRHQCDRFISFISIKEMENTTLQKVERFVKILAVKKNKIKIQQQGNRNNTSIMNV